MQWLYKQYVLGCPVEGVSCRAKDFNSLGWQGQGLRVLASSMKDRSALKNERWCWVKSGELEETLQCRNLWDGYALESEFAIYTKGDKGKVEGLFYLIRNSLAHGSFRYHDTARGKYLAFQTANKGKLRGRAVLSLGSLKAWRSLLDDSGRYLR